jgi:carboxyl-terminal processing protease
VRQVREIILENAIAEVPNEQQLEYGMIRGMVDTLDDPYAIFVEPADHEIQSDQLHGNFGGIGVTLQKDSQNNWRIYPLPGSSAEEAGLHDGDFLLQVEDLKITPDTTELAILAAIHGPIGRRVVITVESGDVIETLRIRRESIAIPSVTWFVLPEMPQIGMIRINRIAETSTEEIQAGVEACEEQGAMKFILDLRDNGGGLVKTGIEIAQLFLEDGTIIHRMNKGIENSIVEVEEPGSLKDLPLVVFINANTASSAEMIAGALKVHQRATLIGQSTFGKTSIQYVFDLEDGSSIHLTSSTWWIPGVEFPLEPDIPLAESADSAVWIQMAIDSLSRE